MRIGIAHALAPNNEELTFTATAPAGITVQYEPSSPVDLPGSSSLNVTLVIEASATAAVGNDSITVKGVSGTNSQSLTFNLDVVQYRVIMENNEFLPQTLNVTVGGTVYWQNLDGPAAGCAGGGEGSGNGEHSVDFTTIPGANSSAISQFKIYSYTFTTPGSYFYYSSVNTDESMNGTINVLAAAGGIGNVAAMPVFSNLKGSGPEIPPAVPITGTEAEPFGVVDEPSPIAADGSASGGTFVPSAHTPTLSNLVSDAGAFGLLGLVVSFAALAMVALGRRSLAAVSLARQMRALSLWTRGGATRTSPPSPS